ERRGGQCQVAADHGPQRSTTAGLEAVDGGRERADFANSSHGHLGGAAHQARSVPHAEAGLADTSIRDAAAGSLAPVGWNAAVCGGGRGAAALVRFLSMSIDSIGLSGIGDGRPMKTADLSRVQAEAAARKRQEALDLQAEGASGIGEPDEDEFK